MDPREKLAFRRAAQEADRTGNRDKLEAMMARRQAESKGKQAELMSALNEVAKVLQGKGDASSKRSALKQISSEMSPDVGDRLKNALASGAGGTGAMMAELYRTITEAEAAEAAAEATEEPALTASQRRNRKKRAKAKAKRAAEREKAVGELLELQKGDDTTTVGEDDDEDARRLAEKKKKKAKTRAKNRRRRKVECELRAQAREEYDREEAAKEQFQKMGSMFEGTPMAGMMEKMLGGSDTRFGALERLMTPAAGVPGSLESDSESDSGDELYEEPVFDGDGSVSIEKNAQVALGNELLRAQREGRPALFAQQASDDAEVDEAARCVATLGVNEL